MRLKPVLAAISIGVLVGAAGCTKTESPKEVASSGTTVVDSDTTVAEPGCPTQLVVDSVNEEFAKLTSGREADVAGAMETMGEYVPSDLQGDFETWQDATLEVADLVDGIDPTKDEGDLTTAEAADLAEAQALMDDPDVDGARSNIKAHFRDECPDIVWSEESSSTTTSSTSVTPTTSSTPGPPSGADCPTQVEIDELSDSFDGTVNGMAYAQQVIAAFNVLDPYLSSDFDDDLSLIRTAYAAYGTSTEGIDPSDPELTPEQQTQYENATEGLASPEVVAALENVTGYFETTCPDIDFG